MTQPTKTNRPAGRGSLDALLAILMNEQTPEEIKKERDALLSIVKNTQEQAKEAERVIKLLIAAGIVGEDKIARAREIARWK